MPSRQTILATAVYLAALVYFAAFTRFVYYLLRLDI